MIPTLKKIVNIIASIGAGILLFMFFEALTKEPKVYGFFWPWLADFLSQSSRFSEWQESMSFSRMSAFFQLVSAFMWSIFLCSLLAAFQIKLKWLNNNSQLLPLGVLLGFVPEWLMLWLLRDAGSLTQHQYTISYDLMQSYALWNIPLLIVLLLTNAIVKKVVS